MPTTLLTGTLTFLFTDIEGSTARWEHHRDAMSAALVRHDELVREAIEAHGGHVFKTGGDAFCAAFLDATDALAAALDAQRTLVAQDWRTFGPDFPDLTVRMGLHTGKADARGGDYFGPALNRTARLMSAGHGGQVLLSLATQQVIGDILPGGVTLRDLGEHRLKDLRHAEHIYQLVLTGLPDNTRSPMTAGELSARDRIVVSDQEAAVGEPRELPTLVIRSVAETFAALQSVIRRDAATVVLTSDQVRQAAKHRPQDLTEYRLGRVAEWSQPRYRLDGRFVNLTLLVDQGEDNMAGRWLAKRGRYDDLGELLADVPEPAAVVLGPPGSGKSTLLRHLELDKAIGALRGEDPSDVVTFFVQLSQYKAEMEGCAPPLPHSWLAARWAAVNPDLSPLDALLTEGRVVLLLDALNEIPAAGDREFRAHIGQWKDWLVRLTKEHPGNRVVFSCRSLDYSATLSTPDLRVPQVQIEAMSDDQVHKFLQLYSPLRGGAIWAAIAGTPQLEALRAPFFLALLADQVEATGELVGDRAGLFTGFIRQALKREVERDNPLFALGELLTSRDLRRIAQWQWHNEYELPERGALVPQLSALAYGMQSTETNGEQSQVRVDYDKALELLDHEHGVDIVRAGVAISVLDEDPASDEVLYRHQLLQEYFAARVLAARDPNPEIVAAAAWHVKDIKPGLAEVLGTLPAAETLPALSTTGWEETLILAAAIVEVPEPFLRELMPHNLVVAGRAARQPTVRAKLSAGYLDELRWALVSRSRDLEADIRARIDAGLVLGWLDDPRFERRTGPHGDYLMPPLVSIPGGAYPIGDDKPIRWIGGMITSHLPRRMVQISPFRIGKFAVTNAEYAYFMASDGYVNEQWWTTAAGRDWRRGIGTEMGRRAGTRWWWRMYQAEPELLERQRREGMPEETYERHRQRHAMTAAELEAHLADVLPDRLYVEPRWWRDERHNNPAQPVVGISWHEALAYCTWLAAQTSEHVRLPLEAEWEAAARGTTGRPYAHGDTYIAMAGNTLELRLRRTTPVGVFTEGDTPEGVSDVNGNTSDWTASVYAAASSQLESHGQHVDIHHRAGLDAGPHESRVARGGRWIGESASAVVRHEAYPDNSQPYFGVRVLVSRLGMDGDKGESP